MTNTTDMAARDLAWLARIQAGDEGAFEQLVRAYADVLYRFAYAKVGDGTVARELVQDLFVRVWDRRAELEVHGTVKSYLFQAIYNRAAHHWQHERRRERVERELQRRHAASAPVVNAGEAAVEEEELAGVIREALATVPPRAREIYLMRREQGLGYEEIAELLGVGLPTVRNQMSRAQLAVVGAVRRWERGEV